MNDSNTSNNSGKSKKKKKVSFSFIEVSTFEDFAKLRKMREAKLNDFVLNKKQTNKYISSLDKRNKILSMSNNDFSSDNENNYINQKINNIPKPNKKDDSSDSCDNINNNSDAYQKKMAAINSSKKEKKKKKLTFSDDDEDIKSNEINSQVQMNIFDKNQSITNINNDIENKENNNEINNENDNIVNNENNNENKNEINNDNNVENNNEKFNENAVEDDTEEKAREEKIKKEKEEEDKLKEEMLKKQKEEEELRKQIEEEEKKKKLTDNISFLVSVLDNIYSISPQLKLNLIEIFFNNLFSYIDQKFDDYINYETTSPDYYQEIQDKTRIFQLKNYYYNFTNNLKEIKKKNDLYQEHQLKAEKYKKYLNYKLKAYAFNILLNFGIKQKAWIQSIQIELNKNLIWSCIDSLKLNVNYHKIKNYLQYKKKKKILTALKNNKQLSINLLKQGKKLCLIYEYRHFFNNCRKKILARKGKEINNKLVKEFRRQNLMRGLVNLIKRNRDIRKGKKNYYKNYLVNKKSEEDYINIKVTQKETVHYRNGSALKRVQNKINVV